MYFGMFCFPGERGNILFFFVSSRRRHTISTRDWSSDVCSSDLAARFRVLDREGWDVSRDGLAGAPPVRVIVGDKRHVTIDRALRLLGLGTPEVVRADSQGRM